MLIVDPKPKHKIMYANASIITPNLKEAKELARNEESDVKTIGSQLVRELASTILITLGEKGMALFQQNGEITEIPTKAREVFDVSGAGDTVVAALALSLAAGADFGQAAFMANHAAGVVVGKVGTATCSAEELRGSIEHDGS